MATGLKNTIFSNFRGADFVVISLYKKLNFIQAEPF